MNKEQLCRSIRSKVIEIHLQINVSRNASNFCKQFELSMKFSVGTRRRRMHV